MALDRHHLQGNKDIKGYAPAHLLCMQINPSLSLVRHLISTHSKAFSLRCSYNNENPVLIGVFPLHLAVQFTESI